MKEYFGVIGTADIAYRRFLPALMLDTETEYIGVATRNFESAIKFAETYGGKVFEGYERIVEEPDITSVYIPLPPALHYIWGMKCFDNGKNVFMEKPCTISLADTLKLVDKARQNQLVLYENYMFLYHKQLGEIKRLLKQQGVLGDMRLVRINFSFPRRPKNDIRYKKELGGGALLDCGGYTVRLAMELIGKDLSVEAAKLNYVKGIDVDMFGTVTLQNREGCVAQLAFGMDNGYKCEVEIIGQKGWIRAPRIFTAPCDYETEMLVNIDNSSIVLPVGKDNQFFNSINAYKKLITDVNRREKTYEDLVCTAKIVEEIRRKG